MTTIPCLNVVLPQKEVVVVVFGHTVGVAGKVAQSCDIKPGASGHLQHAAPGLVAQQLYLCREEQVCVVMPGQVVVGTVSLLMYCQHLGVYYNLRQLGAARFCLRSPVMGQLASPDPSRTGRCKSKRQNNPHDPWLVAESPRSEVRTDAQDAADG